MKSILLKKSWREILKHKLSYIFLTLILGLGLAMSMSLNSFIYTRKQDFNDIYKESRFMDMQLQLQFDQYLSKEEWANIFSQDDLYKDIKDIEYKLNYEVVIKVEDDLIKGQVFGYDVDQERGFGDIEVNRPLFYENNPSDIRDKEEKIYLENAFMTYYELKVGDEVEISYKGQTKKYEIAERINVPEYFVVRQAEDFATSVSQLGIIGMPYSTAKSLFERVEYDELAGSPLDSLGFIPENQDEPLWDPKLAMSEGSLQIMPNVMFGINQEVYNDVAIRWKNYDEDKQAELEDKITELFQKNQLQVKITQKENNPARQLIKDDLEQDEKVFGIFPFIFFSVAAMSLFVVLKRTIDTQKHEIGLYKALGVKSLTIYRYYLILGLIISLFSILFGIILGYWFFGGFNNMLKEMYDFARHKASWDISSIVSGVILTILITVFSVMVPAWLAIRRKPIDALQKKEGLTKGKLSGLVHLFSKLKFVPPSMKISAQYFLRNPFRGLTTVMGIALSFMIFFMMILTLDSMMVIIDDAKSTEQWDYEFQLNGFVQENDLDEFESKLPEKVSNQSGLMLPVTIIGDDDKKETNLLYALPADEIKDYFKISGSKDLKFEEGLVISKYIQSKFDLSKGDEVKVELPVVQEDNSIIMEQKNLKVSAIHDSAMGVYIYTDLSLIQEETGFVDQVNAIYVKDEKMKIDDEKKKGLTKVVIVKSLTESKKKAEQIDKLMESFNQVFYFMIFFSVLMAFAIVYNMFTLNVNERLRDYATMKTLGTTTARVGKLLANELSLVIVLGIGLGTLLGLGLTRAMLTNVSEAFEGFEFEMVFSWRGFMYGVAIILFSVISVFLIAMRRIKKMNLADMIRSRSE